jgi:N12 class adenine-specific DNA methylase
MVAVTGIPKEKVSDALIRLHEQGVVAESGGFSPSWSLDAPAAGTGEPGTIAPENTLQPPAPTAPSQTEIDDARQRWRGKSDAYLRHRYDVLQERVHDRNSPDELRADSEQEMETIRHALRSRGSSLVGERDDLRRATPTEQTPAAPTDARARILDAVAQHPDWGLPRDQWIILAGGNTPETRVAFDRMVNDGEFRATGGEGGSTRFKATGVAPESSPEPSQAELDAAYRKWGSIEPARLREQVGALQEFLDLNANRLNPVARRGREQELHEKRLALQAQEARLAVPEQPPAAPDRQPLVKQTIAKALTDLKDTVSSQAGANKIVNEIGPAVSILKVAGHDVENMERDLGLLRRRNGLTPNYVQGIKARLEDALERIRVASGGRSPAAQAILDALAGGKALTARDLAIRTTYGIEPVTDAIVELGEQGRLTVTSGGFGRPGYYSLKESSPAAPARATVETEGTSHGTEAVRSTRPEPGSSRGAQPLAGERPVPGEAPAPAGQTGVGVERGSPAGDRLRGEPAQPAHGPLPGPQRSPAGSGPAAAGGGGAAGSERPPAAGPGGSRAQVGETPPVARPTRVQQGSRPPDYVMTPEDLADRTPVERFEANIAAIETLRRLVADGRLHAPTLDEQRSLARFSGMGDSAFNPAFDPLPGSEWHTQKAEAIARPVTYDRSSNYDRTASTERYEALRVREQVMNGGKPPTAEQLAVMERRLTPMAMRGVRLHLLIPQEDWAGILRSRLNANYTTPDVVTAMWTALDRMGVGTLDRLRVLEPSAGSGRFLGLMPPTLAARSSRTAIELDPSTGALLSGLFPASDVRIQGFQDATLENSSYDVVISNVPFSEATTLRLARDERAALGLGSTAALSLHNYFFARAALKTRPGGVMAFVTSRYTLDGTPLGRGGAFPLRQALAKQFDLVGAVRLPEGAFPDTKVVTDIVFLRKLLPGEAPTDPSWTHVDAVKLTDPRDGTTHEVALNRYYRQHPEMVLGEQGIGSGMRGRGYIVTPLRDVPISTQLQQAIARLPANIVTPAAFASGALTAGPPTVARDAQIGAFLQTATSLVQVRLNEAGQRVEQPVPTHEYDHVQRWMGLRDDGRALLGAMRSGTEPEQLARMQQAALGRYQDFVRAHGLLSSNANRAMFGDDPDHAFVLSLEDLSIARDAEAEIKELGRRASDAQKRAVVERNVDLLPGPIFSKRIAGPRPVVTSASSPKDAMLIALAETNRIDLARAAELLGKTQDEVAESLIAEGVAFRDPDAGLVTREEYLSGNVRLKHKRAQEAAGLDPARYQRNVAALAPLVPRYKPIQEIAIPLGATWIPPASVEQFMADLLGAPRAEIKVVFTPASGGWQVEKFPFYRADSVLLKTRWGTSRVNAVEVIQAALNAKPIVVKGPEEDANGKPVINQQATDEANAKAEEVAARFADWAREHPQHGPVLAERFNDMLNGDIAREYSGEHLTFPGLNPDISLYSHQKAGVWRILQDGRAILAHVVGSGKTYTLVGAAMEARRLGIARRPMVVVPKSIVQQWVSDTLRAYPGARVLAPESEDFQPAKRRELVARVQTGDYDLVILTQEQFKMLPLRPETQRAGIEEHIAAYEAALAEAEQGSQTQKQIQKLLERMESKRDSLSKEAGEWRDQGLVGFDDLGVDMLMVDEADLYKNLEFVGNLTKVQGMKSGESQRAMDMFLKVRALQAQQGLRGLVFATGTPVSNSNGEVWASNLRYLAPDILDELKIPFFDNFAKTFANIETTTEYTLAGSLQDVQRFTEWNDLEALNTHLRRVMDIVNTEDLPPEVQARLPRMRGGERQVKIAPTYPETQQVKRWLLDREQKIRERTGRVQKGDDIILTVSNDGKAAALDPRMLEPWAGAPLRPDGKLGQAVRNIAAVYHRETPQRGAQLVFMDLGTPKTPAERQKAAEADRFRPIVAPVASMPNPRLAFDEFLAQREVYRTLKELLVAEGLKPEEIAFAQTPKNDDEMAQLFANVRSGRVRVLIGTTAKMGAGVNVQERLAALHHLDVPWRPRDVEQREGRIIRQGNKVYGPRIEHGQVVDPGPGVEVYVYVTADSADQVIWDRVSKKGAGAGAIITREVPANQTEDVSEISAAASLIALRASSDPEVKLFRDVQRELKRASIVADSDRSGRRTAQYALESAQVQEARARALVEALKAVIPRIAAANRGGQRVVVVNGREFVGLTEDALGAAAAAVQAQMVRANLSSPFGSPKVLDTGITMNGMPLTMTLDLTATGQYKVGQRAADWEPPADDYIVRIGVNEPTSRQSLGREWKQINSPEGALVVANNILRGLPEDLRFAEQDAARYQAEQRSAQDVLRAPAPEAVRIAHRLGAYAETIEKRINQRAGGESVTEPLMSLDEAKRTPLPDETGQPAPAPSETDLATTQHAATPTPETGGGQIPATGFRAPTDAERRIYDAWAAQHNPEDLDALRAQVAAKLRRLPGSRHSYLGVDLEPGETSEQAEAIARTLAADHGYELGAFVPNEGGLAAAARPLQAEVPREQPAEPAAVPEPAPVAEAAGAEAAAVGAAPSHVLLPDAGEAAVPATPERVAPVPEAPSAEVPPAAVAESPPPTDRYVVERRSNDYVVRDTETGRASPRMRKAEAERLQDDILTGRRADDEFQLEGRPVRPRAERPRPPLQPGEAYPGDPFANDPEVQRMRGQARHDLELRWHEEANASLDEALAGGEPTVMMRHTSRSNPGRSALATDQNDRGEVSEPSKTYIAIFENAWAQRGYRTDYTFKYMTADGAGGALYSVRAVPIEPAAERQMPASATTTPVAEPAPATAAADEIRAVVTDKSGRPRYAQTAKRAGRKLDDLEQAGHDVGDARDALQEYTDVSRDDYEAGPDGLSEYQDAKADAYQTFLDTLESPEPPEEAAPPAAAPASPPPIEPPAPPVAQMPEPEEEPTTPPPSGDISVPELPAPPAAPPTTPETPAHPPEYVQPAPTPRDPCQGRPRPSARQLWLPRCPRKWRSRPRWPGPGPATAASPPPAAPILPCSTSCSIEWSVSTRRSCRTPPPPRRRPTTPRRSSPELATARPASCRSTRSPASSSRARS